MLTWSSVFLKKAVNTSDGSDSRLIDAGAIKPDFHCHSRIHRMPFRNNEYIGFRDFSYYIGFEYKVEDDFLPYLVLQEDMYSSEEGLWFRFKVGFDGPVELALLWKLSQ